jgi:hypothetical protein
MSTTSIQRALDIDAILDRVIWLVHASCEWNCLDDFRPGYCRNINEHLIDLARCILVCKKWAGLGIPQLWGSYATDANLLALVTDLPQDRTLFDAHFLLDDVRVSIF